MKYPEMHPSTRYLTSWSGGKDSAYAFWCAHQQGAMPVGLMNMLAETGERSRSHGLPPSVLQAQAAALGLPIAFGQAGWSDYEQVWVAQAQSIVASTRATHVVFGDIDLEAHREWEEHVCAQAALHAWLPLWQRPRLTLLEEMLDIGMQALIVSARADCIDLLGETLSPAVIRSLTERGADACGENGEYHTCVTHMPNFSQAIKLVHGDKQISPEGYGFLQVELSTAMRPAQGLLEVAR